MFVSFLNFSYFNFRQVQNGNGAQQLHYLITWEGLSLGGGISGRVRDILVPPLSSGTVSNLSENLVPPLSSKTIFPSIIKM